MLTHIVIGVLLLIGLTTILRPASMLTVFAGLDGALAAGAAFFSRHTRRRTPNEKEARNDRDSN